MYVMVRPEFELSQRKLEVPFIVNPESDGFGTIVIPPT
jgi:hypothetical protein